MKYERVATEEKPSDAVRNFVKDHKGSYGLNASADRL